MEIALRIFGVFKRRVNTTRIQFLIVLWVYVTVMSKRESLEKLEQRRPTSAILSVLSVL